MINQKNTIIILISVILFLFFSLTILICNRYFIKQRNKKELIRLNKKIARKNNELEKLNKELIISNQKQIKLFSIIDQGLRNPLWGFSILIKSFLLSIEKTDIDMIKKSLMSFKESATNIYHLMDNLLQWSMLYSENLKFKPEVFEINEIIDENINLIKQFADNKKIHITFIPDKIYLVMADKNMTYTIVKNLLSNAVKFTPNFGKIKISISEENSFIKTEIKDTGIGMNQKSLKNIFQPNGTLKTPDISKEASEGLGLIICKEFVEINEGKLTAESKINTGSVFAFTLPLSSTKVMTKVDDLG